VFLDHSFLSLAAANDPEIQCLDATGGFICATLPDANPIFMRLPRGKERRRERVKERRRKRRRCAL